MLGYSTMNFDLQRLQKEGQAYIDELVQITRDKAWKELVEARFDGCAQEEIAGYKTIWGHGFMSGAASATNLSIQIHDALQKGSV